MEVQAVEEGVEALGRERFAKAALGVGVWVDWSVPLGGEPHARAATVRLGYRLGLAHAAATAAVRDAVAEASGRVSTERERDYADWRDYVLPVFFERGAGLLRSGIRNALRSDFTWLAYGAGWYSSIGRGLDYRSPLTWTDAETQERIEAAISACSSVATNVEEGARALHVPDGETRYPPWASVPALERTVELSLYALGLDHSRLVSALKGALRDASSAPPLPVLPPSEPEPLAPGQDAREQQGKRGLRRLAEFAALPKPPLSPPVPWPAALAALEAGAGEVERALLAALDDPAPRYGPARALGRQWSSYDETVGRLPLDALPQTGRAEVEALAAEVASRAQAVVAAVDAVESE